MPINESNDPHDWVDQNAWFEHIEAQGWDADYREMVEGAIWDYFNKTFGDYQTRLPFIVASQLDTLWSGLNIVRWNGFPCVDFRAGDDTIDLLAQDFSEGPPGELVFTAKSHDLVVVSTIPNRDDQHESIVERQLRNMKWVKSNFSHLSSNVRGIIIFFSPPNEKAKALLSANPSIEFITKIFDRSVEIAEDQYVEFMNGEITADFLYSLIGPE
ncbi:MAG TPA: hypothetical protein DEP53_10630 [Bacteroidetes bacterium]|nr:hypothetical protein [Bacteroidota bacterium]